MSVPTRRDRLRPVELILLAGVLSIVGGLVVLMVSRDLKFMFIIIGISFVVILVLMATFVLLAKPNKTELADIEELSAEDQPKSH